MSPYAMSTPRHFKMPPGKAIRPRPWATLFQCLTTLLVKTLFLISNLNLLWGYLLLSHHFLLGRSKKSHPSADPQSSPTWCHPQTDWGCPQCPPRSSVKIWNSTKPWRSPVVTSPSWMWFHSPICLNKSILFNVEYTWDAGPRHSWHSLHEAKRPKLSRQRCCNTSLDMQL